MLDEFRGVPVYSGNLVAETPPLSSYKQAALVKQELMQG